MIRTDAHARLADEVLTRGALLIDGTHHDRADGGTYDHVNPTTGQVQAEVVLAGRQEVDDAVRSARVGLARWQALRPDERRETLSGGSPSSSATTASKIASMLSLEAGVPSAVAGGLPGGAADYLAYYAGYADKLEGSVIPIFPENAFDYTVVEPWGVIGMISTWNGGISSISRKAGAALAAGNAVVVKSMELAPFSVLRFGELAQQAGIPDGVVNVISGGAEAGQALCEHPGVDKLSFTGGIETARRILAAAVENLTPVVLELGGKSGNIVFPDADLEAASRFAGAVCMGMAGQGCVFPTRLIVHEDVHDEVVTLAVAAARALPVGDPLDPRRPWSVRW